MHFSLYIKPGKWDGYTLFSPDPPLSVPGHRQELSAWGGGAEGRKEKSDAAHQGPAARKPLWPLWHEGLFLWPVISVSAVTDH